MPGGPSCKHKRREVSIASWDWIHLTLSHGRADHFGKTAKPWTKHETLLTAIATCMRGSTYTTTPATFCTRQASARGSLEGLALTAPIGSELGEDVAAKLPQFGTGFRRKELALAEPW